MKSFGKQAALGQHVDDAYAASQRMYQANKPALEKALNRLVEGGILLEAGYHIPFEGFGTPLAGAAGAIGGWRLGRNLGALKRLGLMGLGGGAGAALGAAILGRSSKK